MNLPGPWRGRACVVYDVADLEAWFAPHEMEIVDSFRSDKRRREWMLSRVAEKELRRRGGAGTYVSYSHAGAFGAAAVDVQPVGIDVEVIRDVSPRAAHLFLSVAEEAAAARCGIADALLHFWSAKEAAWKQLAGGVPTLKRVPLTLIQEGDDGLVFDVVETRRIGSVVVALTRPTS